MVVALRPSNFVPPPSRRSLKYTHFLGPHPLVVTLNLYSQVQAFVFFIRCMRLGHFGP